MKLSDGSEFSMTGPPPPFPHYLNAEGRAVARFAVEGNVVGSSTFSRLPNLHAHLFGFSKKDKKAQGSPLSDIMCPVTGGAGTLGLSAGRALLEHGASGLCLWDLESTLRTSQAEILALAQEFPKQRVFSISVDVTDAESVNEAVESAVQGLGSIDHLFCFAG